MKYLHRFIKLLFAVLLLQLNNSSCEKEYSYEGGNTAPVLMPVDTTGPIDTVVIDPGALHNCPFCLDVLDMPLSSWSFKTGNSLLCGEVDTAFVLNLERSSFTFFGPSFCGADTGLIFTVSLGTPGFNSDLENLKASSAIFYYYHTNQPYVLLSHADQPFSLTITSYSNTTKIATGTFSGTGFRADGRAVNVTGGKFKFKIV